MQGSWRIGSSEYKGEVRRICHAQQFNLAPLTYFIRNARGRCARTPFNRDDS
jgi:hypothetical protein